MDKLKKAGIIVGAVVGGVLGGTLSVAGKVSKIKLIDDIGSSIVDSTLLTGAVLGEVASGTTELLAGKISHNPQKINRGIKELKNTGGTIVNNFFNNVNLVVDNSGEIVDGIKEKNPKKVTKGTKNLAKVVAVGAITVGAIKISDSEEAKKTQNTANSSDSKTSADSQPEEEVVFDMDKSKLQ